MDCVVRAHSPGFATQCLNTAEYRCRPRHWTPAHLLRYNIRKSIEGILMAVRVDYKYLKPKPGSNYRQLFVNGRIRAEVLYRETVGREPLTPEEVAREYGLPLDAVVEAIDYCIQNRELLDEERAREAARIKAAGRDRWPYSPREAAPNA
jgi:hypothetical protein